MCQPEQSTVGRNVDTTCWGTKILILGKGDDLRVGRGIEWGRVWV